MNRVGNSMSVIDLPRLHATGAFFGQVVYEPGGRLGPRVQCDVQLVMIDRGSVEVTIDEQTHQVGMGRVFILWPGHTESFQFNRSVRTQHRWVALSAGDDAVARRTINELRARLRFEADESKPMKQMQELGCQMQRSGSDTRGAALIQLGLAYLAAYTEVAGSHAPSNRRPLPTPVVIAEQTIAQRLTEPLTLDDLAEAASVTPSHLVRLFRKHLDTTPMRLLWDTRVSRGADMLRDTGLSVADVAYRLGFSSPFHFSRLMKQRLGCSPTAWRQRHWHAP